MAARSKKRISSSRHETQQQAAAANEPVRGRIAGGPRGRTHDLQLNAGGHAAASPLAVQWRETGSLQRNARNARTHSKKQIQQIATSVTEFGFNNPILLDSDGRVIAGHGRLAAAKLLDMPQVPTIELHHLSDAQKRAYVLADNKLADLAGWDDRLLALELQYLSELDLTFDVQATGFETAEIDILIGRLGTDTDDPADDVPELPEDYQPTSRVGDLWQLGQHRLLCGNALAPESFTALMAGEKAQLAFLDPPYNVPIDGHVSGLGRTRHQDFVMAAGEMSAAAFTSFLTTALTRLAEHSFDGSIHYICMDWRHMGELLAAGRAAYSELKNLCVWNKDNGGMGAFYRSKHELVFVFKAGTGPHINNFGLGQHGRYRTNVWDYAGVNTLRAGRLEELQMHPTVKPVAMVMDAIKDCSKRNGMVLDSFAGSGTTIIAAEKTGRIARAIELDPKYVDVAIRRWQNLAGTAVTHAATGQSFATLAEARCKDAATRRPKQPVDRRRKESRHD